ncbi:nuclear transport factor 2 family protein [Streptomyces sp. NPDC058755]|uniref:nuclear transport factor 2 family protein n=1 Tax=Streptomyces sp. NPDC058755 TaxID=3346624 RepID=UPI0036C26D0F
MELQDCHDIIETGTRMMWSVDTRDWAALPGLLGDKVVHDFTSIYGGEPQLLAAAEVTGMWSKLIGAFDATQHLLGNHLVTVDGDRGVLTASFQSTHRLANPYGSPQWTLYGTYRFGLARTSTGWKIDEIVMTAGWGEGNKDILTLAANPT